MPSSSEVQVVCAPPTRLHPVGEGCAVGGAVRQAGNAPHMHAADGALPLSVLGVYGCGCAWVWAGPVTHLPQRAARVVPQRGVVAGERQLPPPACGTAATTAAAAAAVCLPVPRPGLEQAHGLNHAGVGAGEDGGALACRQADPGDVLQAGRPALRVPAQWGACPRTGRTRRAGGSCACRCCGCRGASQRLACTMRSACAWLR